MFLKAISLFGFKSFADRVVLRFEPGITAVVGPNGSGKTNVVEALAWVMGEYNVRYVRGTRGEDVIFAGSAARKPLGMAEVCVTLDNSDGVLPIDFSEVSVTRRVYRSGEGEFLLNGVSCKLRDIHDLFLDSGLTRESLSILDRGRLDWVLNASPVDRRLAIEGVAGILRHKMRRRDALRRLEETDRQLTRLQDLVAEVATTLGPIEEEARKARLYREYEEELLTLELSLLVEDYEAACASFERLNREIGAAKGKRDTAEKELAELEEKAEALLREMESWEAETGRLREESAKVSEGYQRIQGEIGVLQERAKAVDERLVLLREEVRRLKVTLSQLEELPPKEKGGTEWTNPTLLEERIRDREAKRAAVRRRISVKRSASEKLKAELIEVLNLEARLRYQLEAAARSRSWVDEHEALSELRTLDRQLKACTERILELSRRLDSIRSSSIPYEGPRLILERHRTGSWDGPENGIVGVVIDLIEVPQEYVVAIEVALGPAAANVVTRTERDARVAIDFLKRVKGGRATFLPLDTLRPHPMSEEERRRALGLGAIDVASRLVRCDPELRGVVEYLLGRTIVAEDINRAVQVARGFGFRVRCVSLGGDLVHAGGAITGGSRERAPFGAFGRRNEIARLEAELESLRASSAELEGKREAVIRESIKEKTARVERLRLRAERIKLGIDRLEEQIRSDTEKEHSLEEELTGFKVSLASARRDREVQAKELERKRRERESYLELVRVKSQEVAGLESESLSLRRLISEKAGELKGIHAFKEELESRLMALQRERSQKASEASRTDRRLKSLRKVVSDAQTALYELELERERVESARSRMEGEIRLRMRSLSRVEEFAVETCGTRIPSGLRREGREARALRIRELKEKMDILGEVNPGSIDEFERLRSRYEFLKREQLDVEQARKAILKVIREIDGEVRRLFLEAFEQVNAHFGETFQRLFGGGRGELRLVDRVEEDGEEDGACEGVEIQVQPPGKKIRSLNMLSGGERALTGIAFLLSLLLVRRIPFCVLDEVDAPLDEVNAGRLASLLRLYSGKTQMIIITHQKEIMEIADVLYGITMAEEGISQVVSVQLDEKAG